MSTTVDQPSAAVAKMAVQWAVTEALIGGTPTMRAAGATLLPKWPKEEEESYKTRLAQATLFPAYGRTVRVMAGKPFSKALTLDKAPSKIEEWCQDVDRQGVSLNVFAAEMFEEAIGHGLAGILVDTPRQATPNERAPTQAEQAASGMRPYFVRVMHRQILGWRVESTQNGPRLAQLRLHECTAEPDGEWGEKDVERVRVLTPGAWTLYRKGSTGWGEDGRGTTGIDVIPFVPLYGIRKAFMVGAAPLLDLAYQNIEHWQSKSDQQNILHVARVPILTLSGVASDDASAIVIGAGVATKIPQGSELKYTEHTGKSIEAGRNSLLDLEERMIATGAELLVAKAGVRTAEESSNDAEANKSDLQRIGEMFEDSLDQALSFMAILGGQQDTTSATLFKDYAARSLSEASAQLIVTMQQGGLIRKETAIREQQRRGVLSSDIDPVVEPTLAAEEAEPDGEEEDDPPTPGK